MDRKTVWAFVGILLIVPLAAAQGPPEESPAGRPSATPTPTEGTDPATPTDGARPNETAQDGPGRSPSTPAAQGNKGRAPVDIVEAKDGFGVRPVEPASGRPAFSYNASRAAMMVERPDAPAMQSVVDAIVEFRDEDGDGAYDLGEPVLQRHALHTLPLEIRSPSVHIRDAVYALPANGSLTLRFQLDPDEDGTAAKYDVRIEDFPFSDPTTRVALGTRAEAAGGLRLGTVDGQPALIGDGTGARPYLSWVSNVTSDGADATVAASVHVSATGADATVYWAYPQAAILVHDPTMGYISVPLERLGDPVLFAAALGVGGILLLAGYETRRRFRP